MSLLHPAILYGLGLVTLPVILHLLLKQKPKKLLFPALQLIANRRKQNVSRMRLRHFWLLLLRMLVIGLLVLAIARPSVPAADYSLNLREVLTILALVGLAIGAYVFLSRRWRAGELPQHERRYRQTRLRTWLIAGTLALLMLMVAWPYQRRIAAELKTPTPGGDVSLPVAAIFLFDSSLSMTYQQEGKTRLDLAQELAIEHLSDLAAGSKVAVADVANDNPILFQTTIAGAKSRIESLEPHPVSLPLNDRIRAALRLQEDDRARTLSEQSSVADDERKDRYLRRIYVLSDLAGSAFRIGGKSRLAAALAEQPQVHLFLVDVSDESPMNTGLTSVEPSRVQLSEDGTLEVKATIARTQGKRTEAKTNADNAPETAIADPSNGRTYTVELLLQDSRGKPVKVDQRTIGLPDETPQELTFGPFSPESGPVVHGEVRLVASDPMPFDDSRRFTVEVRPPLSVLVIAPTDDDAAEWSVALEVEGYQVDVRGPEEIARLPLADYAVVNLINVPRLSDNDWYRLGDYVQQGGGLAVFLGDTEINSVNYARDEAQVFLPGRLKVHSAPGVSFLRVANDQHPLFRQLAEDDGIALLESADVDRFWRVTPADDAGVLARYSEDREAPAILERIHGKGRTVMVTTAVDIKGFRRDWNILPNPQWTGFWTFLALADEMMRYLSHQSESQLTYDAGEMPVLRMTGTDEDREFLLQQPGFRQSRVTLKARESLLTIADAADIGHYNLRTQGERAMLMAGFSINTRAAESTFTRITTEQLNELFGEERYQVARSIGELKESINIADLGRELFPIILIILVLFFLGEHFVANWFYDAEGSSDPRSSWSSPPPETAVA